MPSRELLVHDPEWNGHEKPDDNRQGDDPVASIRRVKFFGECAPSNPTRECQKKGCFAPGGNAYASLLNAWTVAPDHTFVPCTLSKMSLF
jgi:hypothetical protein